MMVKRDLKADLEELESLKEDIVCFIENNAEKWLEQGVSEAERAEKAEALARELVAALQGVSGMLDYATGECRCGVCEYCNVQKRADKALAKAEEVLGEVICNIHDNPELLGVD